MGNGYPGKACQNGRNSQHADHDRFLDTGGDSPDSVEKASRHFNVSRFSGIYTVQRPI
jgi:hypothetical protein